MYKTYAMILNNQIIDVVTSKTTPHYPPDADGNIVTAVECDNNITLNDFYNPETGKCEHIQVVIPEPEPTQSDRIEEQNLNIMTAMAEMYEEAQTNRLDDMEVQATIYEAILMGGI